MLGSGMRLMHVTSALRNLLVLRRQLEWKWYCNQDDAVAKQLKRLVVGWLPSLLITLWQGMVLPLVFILIVQVRGFSSVSVFPI